MREIDRQRQIETERQRQKDRERQRETDREMRRQRERKTKTERETYGASRHPLLLLPELSTNKTENNNKYFECLVSE